MRSADGRTARRAALAVALSLAMPLAGCDAGVSEGSAAPETSRAPARAGTVWVVDTAGGRATAPAALLAYVHGLHVVVLDDDDAYAGMKRLRGTREEDGAHRFQLDGTDARVVPVDDGMELRFGSGEVIALRRQDASDGGGSR
jgi:hypothetical protein